MKLIYKYSGNTADIEVPLSKSICNRMLILQSLFKDEISIEHLSIAEDTQILHEALQNKSTTLQVGAAGTAMRFLTARACVGHGEVFEIYGTERMHQRPIRILVDALRSLGAKIEYLQNDGFPPLRIHSGKLAGGEVQLNPSVSSQYVSALMLIAPALEKGLKIVFTERPVSFPYIQMTGKLLQSVGLSYKLGEREVEVLPGNPRATNFTVERDWSGIAPWMMFAALEKSELFFPDFKEESIQGDARIVQLVEAYGVRCHFEENGLRITGGGPVAGFISVNLNDQPDLAQVMIVAAALMNMKGKFTGLSTLIIKETNRLEALKEVLANIGIPLEIDLESATLVGGNLHPPVEMFKTYEDHRMAFTLMLIASRFELEMDHPEVVSKSYPNFWQEAAKLGFSFVPKI